MRKFILVLTLALTILSCKKDKTLTEPDYSAFIGKTTPTFYGTLGGKSFSWTIGFEQSQGMEGYENGNGVYDSTDPERVVLFGLASESDLQTRFTLYSPRYNAESDTEISRVFSFGIKTLGDLRNNFYLSIYKDGTLYQSRGSNPSNEIEIIQTEPFVDNSVPKLRVWFRINAKLSTCDCQSDKPVSVDGLMIAEFYGVKK